MIQNKYDLLQDEIDVYESQLLGLESQYSNINKAVGLLKSAKLYKINTRSQILIDLINLALKDIFFDKDVKIDIQSNETNSGITGYNVTYDIIIYKNGNELAKNQDIYDSNGGGVITIVSFILKILMGYINNSGNFFIFDEAFSQLSAKYLDNLSFFIRELCEKYNLHILFIAHENISKHAHLSYRFKGSVTDGVDTLLLDEYDINVSINDKLVKKHADLDDFYLLKAEKFQSINKIELPIKGFTCIRGDSDIGKTAIARAINSIINNDFKPKYKRINSRGSVLIQFGYVSNCEYNKLTLEFKGSSVHYILNSGEELKGKALAKDRITDALTEFGFKKIDTSVYKSWNSELAEQTNRINVTTQHDKLYFSNERNSTEKLLTLLFNSENFNEGIREGTSHAQFLRTEYVELQAKIRDAKIKQYELLIYKLNISKELLNKIKIAHANYSNLNSKKNKLDTDLEYINMNFNLMKKLIISINNISNCNTKYVGLSSIKSNISKISERNDLIDKQYKTLNFNYNSYIKINKYIDSMNTLNLTNSKINHYNVELNIINSKYKILTNSYIVYKTVDNFKYLNKLKNRYNVVNKSLNNVYESFEVLKSSILSVNKIKTFIQEYNLINAINSKIELINNKLKLYSKLDIDFITKINNLKSKCQVLISTISKKESLNEQIKSIQMNINKLDSEIHSLHDLIEDCPHCAGLGYIIKDKE